MEDLKVKYDKIVAERKEIAEQLNTLAEVETVKRFLELQKQNVDLSFQQNELYKQIKFEEYSSCDHIWVATLDDYDRCEGRSHIYYGCIKCGLDQRIFYSMDLYGHDSKLLNVDEKIMYDYMRKHGYRYGSSTGLFCNFDLAKAIYSKILEAHPDIDDETAIKYFRVALHNIRDTRVSDDRKANRAKRLSLGSKFNKWN